MRVNQVVDIQIAEKKEKIVNDTICTILGAGVYGMCSLLCIGFATIIPSMAVVTYISYGLVGVCLGSLATIVLKEDVKEYKKYKAKVKPYYEHFPFVIKENEYEKRPRYQVDREKDCKVEDFYKEPSSYPTNFVYEKEEKDVTLAKKYRK